jgi:hypothetical protein
VGMLCRCAGVCVAVASSRNRSRDVLLEGEGGRAPVFFVFVGHVDAWFETILKTALTSPARRGGGRGR